MDNRRISFCCPTYNREDVLFESFAKIIADERLQYITLSDDASEPELLKRVVERINTLQYKDKITLIKNLVNKDCFINKFAAILGADANYTTIAPETPWAILGDSDNIFDVDYLDTLFAIEKWEDDTIYTPEFAFPNFDFRAYSGITFIKENIAEYIDLPMVEVCLNACNYFVNRGMYVKVRQQCAGLDPVTSDSIYFCLKWLEAGNKIKVVEGLQYFHRVHSGSHYQNNISRTPTGLHQNIVNDLRSLK